MDHAQQSAIASQQAPPLEEPAEAPYPNPIYAWYVVAVLTLVYIFSFLDRQILNLLVAPVRRDLHISDTQTSLLIGIAFAAFYVSFGLPIGRIADSRSRRGLISVGFFLWSLFCAGCGLAQNFPQLAIMRMGVGVGEAALGPAAYSLITDYFPPHRRGIALGMYSMGITLGSGTALVLGGLITGWTSLHAEWTLPLVGAVRSWQVVFLVIGLAGMLLIPIMGTVREPQRRGTAAGSKATPIPELLRYLKTHWKTYGSHNLGLSLQTLAGYASMAWMPTFFIRHHHWSASKAGVVLGAVGMAFGSLGVYAAGWLANRMYVAGRRDACFFVGILSPLFLLLSLIALVLAPTATAALILFVPVTFLTTAFNGVGPMALMQITPQRMRGQASALYLFLISIIGLGLGPTAVALCTDYWFHDDGMVGYSLMLVSAVALPLSAVVLWYGRRHFIRTLDAAARWSEAKAA